MKRLTLITIISLLLAVGLQAQSGIGGGGSGGGSGGNISNPASPVMGYYFTNACPVANTGQCYYTPANTQLANDCTWSNVAATVTCGSAHFAATDVGKRFDGYLSSGVPGGAVFGCGAGRTSFTSMGTSSLTIASYQSATQVTLNANPSNTATSNHGCVIWGTPDDANASTFETAYAAVGSSCPKVFLAAANYWFDNSGHFSSQPVGCAALPSNVSASTTFGNMVYTAGFELEGRGPGNTLWYFSAIYPGTGNCTLAQGAITNACQLVPVEGKFKDFQMTGGGQSACQVASAKNLLGVTVGTLEDISLTNFCYASPQNQIGIKADLLAQLYQINNSGFGITCLQTTSNEPYVQAFKLACENSSGSNGGNAVDVLSDTSGAATFTCWGCLLLGAISSTNMNVVGVGAGANVRLIGGIVANCEAGSGCTTTSTALFKNSGGNLYLTDVTSIAQGGATPVGGLNCASASSNNYLERTILANTGNANYGGNNAGCKLYDLGGNGPLFTGVANNGLSGAVIADGRSLMFSCTGTANASVTNSLYGSGPNVTATTCAGQTATLGTGIPMQNARTLAGIIATSSATTVSVAATLMVNGSTTSTTCTMTAATSCSNFTTTSVNSGDLLSVKIVTGAAETGANIKVQAIWQ